MPEGWCLVRFDLRTFAVVAALTLPLASCGGGENPFGDPNAAAPTAPTDVAPPTSEAPVPAASTPVEPLDPLPTTPADAPSPNGTTPKAAPSGKDPAEYTPEELLDADQTAMLNARTMVSVIEGCHSGRQSYKDCNTHDELGDPSTLGLEIGKKPGQVQISATDNGFRITAHSMSGAKFTVARGPSGDRFKCISGPRPSACPEDRKWSW